MEKETESNKTRKTKILWRGFIIRLFILLLLVLASTGSFFVFKIYKAQLKINSSRPIEQKTESFIDSAKSLITSERKNLRGEDRGRINILLLGMGGEGHSGEYLTDTIILASVDPKTYQSALLSIPRDLYVDVPDLKISTKINAVYAYGMKNQQDASSSLGSLEKVVTNITGQPIDYYIAMDFDGFKKIIDEVDGIDIEVPNDIKDTSFPGPNFSYQTFEISKGFHHLDGETALKYSRVRHVEGGDFGRASRQQQVMAATKKKASSLGTLFDPAKISGLIDILGDHLRTDIRLSEVPAFLQIVKNINVYQTSNKVLDAWNPDSLLASSHKPLGGVMAYVLLPRTKNYSQIRELSDRIFDMTSMEKQKQSIQQEDASIGLIISRSDNPGKIRNILNKLGYGKVTIKTNNQYACPDKSVVYNNSDQPKLFTLNDLADKLEAEIKDEKISSFQEDILACLSDDTIDYFSSQNESQQEENSSLQDQSVMDESGNVRFNKSQESN